MTVPVVAVTELAAGSGADAPTLVLGSSLGTSELLWEQVVPLLPERWRLLVWDLPGHGRSEPATAEFTMDELADAVADAVTDLAPGPIRYAGVSLGGAVGLALLLRYPALVERAAIIASGAKIGDADGWHARAAQVRTQGTSALIIGSAQRWFAPDTIATHPDHTGRMLHVLAHTDDASYAWCCEALAAFDVREQLREITAPVVAVWGAHDAVTPEASARLIAETVQNGRAVGITTAAHLPPVDDAATTAQVLRDFFGV
jgi:3-oxoadipate enol-lactonase